MILQNLCVLKYKNPAQTVPYFMISQTLRKGKYFSKISIMNLKLSKSEYLSDGKKIIRMINGY